MKIQQRIWTATTGWTILNDDGVTSPALVLYFGAGDTLDDGKRFDELRQFYPTAHLAGSATLCPIAGLDLIEDGVVATAIEFREATVQVAQTSIDKAAGSSYIAGVQLATALPHDDLRGVFILSDRLTFEPYDLVRGVRETLPADIQVTGGMAVKSFQDISRPSPTGADEKPEPRQAVLVGLYGQSLRYIAGSAPGGESIGPLRIITRSEGDVIFELDGRPILDLYKKMLGDRYEQLNGYHFPLVIHAKDRPDQKVMRTAFFFDEERNAVVFSGRVPEGFCAQLTLVTTENFIDGATQAANKVDAPGTELALIVSCLVRKILLAQRAVEEIEAVGNVLGPECRLAGFYAGGEVETHGTVDLRDVHSQTMAITTMSER